MLIAFVRHASTDWNADGRMQGRRDVPLSVQGRGEAWRWRAAFDAAESIRWLSSPLARAVETATLMAGRAPTIEPALVEMDWAEWEGRTLDELAARHGDAFVANGRRGLDVRPPGGESPREVAARVRHWLATLAVGAPIVAVTHNGVLRALLSMATGWDMTGKPPVKLRPATLHRFALARDGRLSACEWNVPLERPLSAARPGAPPRLPAPSRALP
jgi:probable phosphoglycerate mutase